MNQLVTIRTIRSGVVVRNKMKTKLFAPTLTVLSTLMVGFIGTPLPAADGPGVAIAIVYDTSGSMKETVRDSDGKSTAKYLIANRALSAVAAQIDTFVKNAGGTPRNVQAALFTFQGDTAKTVIPMGPFDAKAIQDWARKFTSPNGSTPLGNSLAVATQEIQRSAAPRKHILLITDGMNTAGPSPENVLPRLKKQALEKSAPFSVHFVAFDVDAKMFNPLKKLDVTVVGADDEKQLNAQLNYILQEKILLEDEDPKQ